MQKIKLLLLPLAIIALSSCGVTNSKTTAVYQHHQFQAHAPLTEIVVDKTKKVSGVATGKVLFGLFPLSYPNSFSEPTSGSKIKAGLHQAAVFNAIGQTKYNTIIAPRFTSRVEKGLFVKKVTVQVTGWGAVEKPKE